jgi:hypothetical protein
MATMLNLMDTLQNTVALLAGRVAVIEVVAE